MIITKNIKSYLALSFIIIACIGLESCDFEKDETINNIYINEAANQRVKVNIEEAKVLSDIAILNETLIALNNVSEELSNDYSIKQLSKKLKKDHLKIEEILNDLARNKLIILPTRLDENEVNELSKTEATYFKEAYLNKVENLVDNEIAQLEYLATITNDVDFKVLTVKALVKLNYNLTQINKNHSNKLLTIKN